MKRATAQDKQDTYQVSGGVLQIYWDEQQHTREDMDGETETYYSYAYANAKPTDGYAELVRAIIHSQYTYDDEIALINNKEDEPEKYADYQAFRQVAKDLANGYEGK
jgi:hypothetical protein